jgi:predicted porin
MQKKLIALAIAGLSGAAFAQSTVTISGNLDMGYLNVSNETAAQGKDTQRSWSGNGSSTSTLVFSGTEALGGGMNAGFLLSSDFTPGAQQQTNPLTATGGLAVGTTAPTANQFFNSQNYLSLGGSWGMVKFGNVNQTALDASSASQPFGTAIGSGYGSAISGRLRGLGTAGNLLTNVATATGAGRLVRVSNSAKYESPSFSGFQVTGQHAFKNDNDQFSNIGLTELGLKYGNGPVNVVYSNTKMDSGDNTIGVVSASTTVKQVTTHNMLGGNYTFGPATVMAGWTSSKQDLNSVRNADARSWNIALKYAVGNWAFMGNVLKIDDKLAASDADSKLTGLGLDYSMSKRTTAYARYETGDTNTGSVGGTNVGAFTRWAAGMRHSF